MKKKIKKSLIFGLNGQDGSLMANLLLKKNYKVAGVTNNKNYKNLELLGIKNKIKIINCNIKSYKKIRQIINNVSPDEIYNFAGISTLHESENDILNNDLVNNHSVLNIMFSIIQTNKKIKFFQSLSSELFKKKYKKNIINEKSKFDINNCYSIAKISSFYYLKFLRKKYNLNFYSGFLFNHTSFYAKNKFIIKKIVENLYKIKKNKLKKMYIGNLNVKRDWMDAEDLILIIWQIMQQKKADDFVIGSGQLTSLKTVINEVAKNFALKIKWKINKNNPVGINLQNNKIIIQADKKLGRKEPNFAVANIAKIKKKLNKFKIKNINEIIKKMCKQEQRGF
tara:strand:+ start:1744 stop:2757 length:1014 start_codon:yes stop_codon:yes gene_type:complete